MLACILYVALCKSMCYFWPAVLCFSSLLFCMTIVKNFLPLQMMLQFCIFLESKINGCCVVFPPPLSPFQFVCLQLYACFAWHCSSCFHMHMKANLYVFLRRYPYCSDKKLHVLLSKFYILICCFLCDLITLSFIMMITWSLCFLYVSLHDMDLLWRKPIWHAFLLFRMMDDAQGMVEESILRQHQYNEQSMCAFTLDELWRCYDEWSVYGAGVPLALPCVSETIMQYYVPYLSAMQIYLHPGFTKRYLKMKI